MDKDPNSREKPSTTLPGKVEKIIKSPDPTAPEKAQIAVEGAEELYREVRINNVLKGENGKGKWHSRKGPRWMSPSKRTRKTLLKRPNRFTSA